MRLAINTDFASQVANQAAIELEEARMNIAEVEAVLTALHVLGHYTPPLWRDEDLLPAMPNTEHVAGIHIDFVPAFKPGDPPPPGNGYNEWHEWAEVQHKGGLRQTQCAQCQRYLFPQEMEGHRCQS